MRADLRSSVSRLVTGEGGKPIPVVADVRNLNAIKQAVDTAVSQFGRVDILVANAGIAIWSPFAQMKPDQWQSVIDVNLTGVANSMWAVIPQMQKQKSGKIITLTLSVGKN